MDWGASDLPELPKKAFEVIAWWEDAKVRDCFPTLTSFHEKKSLIRVKVYFVAFSAQRDTWIPTARHDKRIDMRSSILSSKNVNGLSPRADEATPPEESTTNPKMPTQTNKESILRTKQKHS